MLRKERKIHIFYVLNLGGFLYFDIEIFFLRKSIRSKYGYNNRILLIELNIKFKKDLGKHRVELVHKQISMNNFNIACFTRVQLLDIVAWFDVVELTNQTADNGTGALQEARTLTGMISKYCNPHTLKSYVSFYELLEEQ